MIIRIKRKLYFKPRLCPDCAKPCLFCKCHLSERCRSCHKKHDNKRHRQRSHKMRMATKKLKYNSKYKRIRKGLLKSHPYCSLCGTANNLTVHHVGGGAIIIQFYAMGVTRRTSVGI